MRKKYSFTSRLLTAVFAVCFNYTALAETQNLSLLKEEIKTYHNSGAYQKEISKVIIHAHDYILRRTKKNNLSAHPQKLAVVLDIDETVLSNYDAMAAQQFCNTKQQIHKEILTAKEPAIRPMLFFYNDLLKHGITLFFVTGRDNTLKKATISNLKRAGYHDWAGLYFRPDHYKEASVIPYKSKSRANITEKGYTVIASIGDQDSDLKGGYAEKTFKLPNPYYYIP